MKETKKQNDVSRHVTSIARGLFYASPLIKKRLARLKAIQAEQGLPLSHVQVLALLDQHDSLSISEISRRFDIAKPNITPLIDRLVSAGLVDRVRSDSDRRVVNIVIQDAGRQQLNMTEMALNEHVAGWSSSLSVEDFLRLDEALQAVVSVLEKL